MCLFMKQVLLHIAFLICAPFIYGQHDTIDFPVAEVVSTFHQRNSDFNTIIIDSIRKEAFTFQHIGNLVQAYSGGFIKGYGAGQIATISLRGTGAAHTTVFWEGLNLQSASLGQVDFSTVPSWFFTGVEVNKGPSVNANIGASSAGGLIQLNSNENNNYIQAGILRGSFGLQQQYGIINLSKRKWKHRFGVSYDDALNDFEITETKAVQTNADTRQTNVIGQHSYFINNKNKIGVAYWFGDNFRNIPPTIGQSTSSSSIDGINLKSSLTWSHYHKTWRSLYSFGIIHDDLNYIDPAIQLQSTTKGNTIQNNWTTEGEINKLWSWQSVVQHQYLSVVSSGYEAKEFQHRNYFGLSVNYLKKQHSISAGLGMHVIEQMKRIPLPAIKYSCKWSKSLQLTAKYAGVFKAPTFNDLYWYPLGNPELLPENGWSTEIGTAYTKRKDKNEFSASANVFTGKIKNWIIWLPVDGNWRPENKLLVENKGVELLINYKASVSGYQIWFNANTNYMVSKNIAPKFEYDKSVDKQLIYVPFQNSFAGITITRKNFSINTVAQYTGARYITVDNSSVLPAYTICNASINYTLSMNKTHLFNVGFTALNMFNTQYQPVLGRPMPGINYQVKLIYTLKNKTK